MFILYKIYVSAKFLCFLQPVVLICSQPVIHPPPMPGSKKMAVKKRKKLSDYQEQQQLMLPFELPKPDQTDYTNAVNFYDAIPKYHWARRLKRTDGKFLESLKKSFKFKQVEYKAIIKPARIVDSKGDEKEYYPGRREELVEEALRKMATEGQGTFLDEHAGVRFTLYGVQKELKRMGHTYSIAQIKLAIRILASTEIVIISENKKDPMEGEHASHLFENYGFISKEDWQRLGKDTKCFVIFNTYVTKSIKNKTFRRANYKRLMSYKKDLARYMERRISRNFTQATSWQYYTILASTIVNESGMSAYAAMRNNIREICKALDEMEEKGAITKYEATPIREDPKRKNSKIIDAKFEIRPSPVFAREIKAANAISKQVRAEVVKKLTSPAPGEARGSGFEQVGRVAARTVGQR